MIFVIYLLSFISSSQQYEAGITHTYKYSTNVKFTNEDETTIPVNFDLQSNVDVSTIWQRNEEKLLKIQVLLLSAANSSYEIG